MFATLMMLILAALLVTERSLVAAAVCSWQGEGGSCTVDYPRAKGDRQRCKYPLVCDALPGAEAGRCVLPHTRKVGESCTVGGVHGLCDRQSYCAPDDGVIPSMPEGSPQQVGPPPPPPPAPKNGTCAAKQATGSPCDPRVGAACDTDRCLPPSFASADPSTAVCVDRFVGWGEACNELDRLCNAACGTCVEGACKPHESGLAMPEVPPPPPLPTAGDGGDGAANGPPPPPLGPLDSMTCADVCCPEGTYCVTPQDSDCSKSKASGEECSGESPGECEAGTQCYRGKCTEIFGVDASVAAIPISPTAPMVCLPWQPAEIDQRRGSARCAKVQGRSCESDEDCPGLGVGGYCDCETNTCHIDPFPDCLAEFRKYFVNAGVSPYANFADYEEEYRNWLCCMSKNGFGEKEYIDWEAVRGAPAGSLFTSQFTCESRSRRRLGGKPLLHS